LSAAPPPCENHRVGDREITMKKRSSARGFGLVELMAVLVIILGLWFAARYYKDRPADDPKAIDSTLPNYLETTNPAAATNYYLEGTIHKVERNERGAVFTVTTPGGKSIAVVGSKNLTGGLANVAAGQLGEMQVQLNAGLSLQATASVVGLAHAPGVFVYKYRVKTPAPENYREAD
jgi:prepilin-type N-terminal cleavage/methylation domain-containing protein